MSRLSEGALALAYTDAADGEALPVLFVHGFAHNRFVWAPLLEGAGGGAHRSIVVDLRGHGDSPWSPDGGYAPWHHAADLLALMDALGLRRCAVVGHSLGGLAAILLAAAHPDRVSRLALLDVAPRHSIELAAALGKGQSALEEGFDSPEQYADWLAIVHPQCGDRAALRAFASRSLVRRLDGRYVLRMDPGVMGGVGADRDLAAAGERVLGAVDALDVPTLLLRGERSAVLSEEEATSLMRRMRGDASQATIADAGHSIMLDAPLALREALGAFLG